MCRTIETRLGRLFGLVVIARAGNTFQNDLLIVPRLGADYYTQSGEGGACPDCMVAEPLGTRRLVFSALDRLLALAMSSPNTFVL